MRLSGWDLHQETEISILATTGCTLWRKRERTWLCTRVLRGSLNESKWYLDALVFQRLLHPNGNQKIEKGVIMMRRGTDTDTDKCKKARRGSADLNGSVQSVSRARRRCRCHRRRPDVLGTGRLAFSSNNLREGSRPLLRTLCLSSPCS